MAAVDDATSAVGADVGWFKVSEMGLVSNNTDYFGSRAFVSRVATRRLIEATVIQRSSM